ncbi:MAG: hypothetical protein ACRDF0_09265 [Candidatus Limnocylindria bacterium]
MSVTGINRAVELRRQAVEHKRLTARHRRLAHMRMDERRALCRDLGLTFVEVDRHLGTTTTEGGEAHGRPEARRD